MSPQTIEMHFAEIMHLSEQLSTLAKSLKLAAEEELMQNICENKACWNSECADILAGKEVKLAGGITARAKDLEKIAGEMEDQAKRMYQSEMLNIQLAATRIY